MRKTKQKKKKKKKCISKSQTTAVSFHPIQIKKKLPKKSSFGLAKDFHPFLHEQELLEKAGFFCCQTNKKHIPSRGMDTYPHRKGSLEKIIDSKCHFWIFLMGYVRQPWRVCTITTRSLFEVFQGVFSEFSPGFHLHQPFRFLIFCVFFVPKLEQWHKQPGTPRTPEH